MDEDGKDDELIAALCKELVICLRFSSYQVPVNPGWKETLTQRPLVANSETEHKQI